MKVRFTPSARTQFFAGLEYIKARKYPCRIGAFRAGEEEPSSVEHVSTVGSEDSRVP